MEMETQKEKSEVEGAEEDVPSDFFDDFTKDDFIEGLSVIDSWDEEGGKRRVPRIDAEAVESVRDLRELIRDGKEDGGRADGPRSDSQSRLDDYIKPGSRRDPSKVNAAIRRDKEVKVKEYLAKHLQSTDELRPPGTELDDFFQENKPKDTKMEQRPVVMVTEPYKHRESPPREMSRYASSRRRSPYQRDRFRSPLQRRYSPPRGYTRNRYPSPRRHTPPQARGKQFRENRNRSPLRMASRGRRYSPLPTGRRSRDRSPYERPPRYRSPYSSRSRVRGSRSPLERDLRHQSPLNRRSRSRSGGRRSVDYPPDPVPHSYGGDAFQGGPSYLGPPLNEFSGVGPMPSQIPMPGQGPMPGYAFPQGPVPAYQPPVMNVPAPYNAYPGPEMACVPAPEMPQPVPAPMLPTPAPVDMLPRAPPMVPPPQQIQPASNNFYAPGPGTVKPYDALAQLVAEGKLSQEDYLKLAPNKGVNTSLDTKARVDVLNRCNEALSKLVTLKVPNRLLMNTTIPGVEQKAITPKFCSPLKRQAPVEFMFTRASGSAAARHNKQLLDSILATIGLDKVLSRPKNKPKKNTKDAAVQTTKPYCDVCEIRDAREFFDASTHIDAEHFSVSVHTQVLEQDLESSSGMFPPGGIAGANISIAHMTPAQLVSQLAARAKTLKQSDPEPPPPPSYGRRPNYEYDGRGAPPYDGRGAPPYEGRGAPPYDGRGGPPYDARGGPPYDARGGQQYQNNYDNYNRY